MNDDLIDDFGGIFIQWQIIGFAGRFTGSPSGVGHHFGQFRILARESVGSANLVRVGVAQVDGHFVDQVVEQETLQIFAQHVQDKEIAKGYARNHHFGRVLNQNCNSIIDNRVNFNIFKNLPTTATPSGG